MAVEAVFRDGSTKTYTRTLTQYDKGQILKFVGITLPETFEVHFSNTKDYGAASVMIGVNNEAPIPDAYLATGEYVYAWLYYEHDITCYKEEYEVTDEVLIEEHVDPVTFTKGTNLYQVTIPVNKRPIDVKLPPAGISDHVKEYSVDGESLIIK